MQTSSAWSHALAVTRPALDLARADYLDKIAADLRRSDIQAAVSRRYTPAIFDWMVSLLALQGISDRVAFAWDAEHGGISWAAIEASLAASPPCPKLKCYWAFSRCGFRKGAATCNNPALLPSCPLPQHDLRKGLLNRAAHGLHLFVRDVCGGDLIAWLDQCLAGVRPPTSAGLPLGPPAKAASAVIWPLAEVDGIGLKVAALMLADLLLAGDPTRPAWVAAGAEVVVVDTLVHAFLKRTGILRRLGAEHRYGAACYAEGGCAEIIRGLAHRFDARSINPTFPAYFPRLIQSGIWSFCAADQANICNGVRIDDRHRCRNASCPAYAACDRVRLGA